MPAPKSPEFRRRALDLVAQGEPVAATARNLGISESCLRRWMATVRTRWPRAIAGGVASGASRGQSCSLDELTSSVSRSE
ncbi:TPA: helix-turn-helix domain-containing protein [Legionella pneumophila]|nr:helix-turn-helix domain-containing protein [Legionella pneumophila]